MACIPRYYEFKTDVPWVRSNGETRMVSYLLMENCQGLEIFDFVNEVEGITDEALLRYIFKEILKALNALHKAGMAHRDVKLENMMITYNYEVKLIDMGMFSPLVGTGKTGFFSSKKGTPQYMCPEVHKGAPYQGADADLFATFVALFIMRMFRYPFQAAISKGSQGDYNYYCLQRSDTKEYWDMFEDEPSAEFKNIVEVML